MNKLFKITPNTTRKVVDVGTLGFVTFYPYIRLLCWCYRVDRSNYMQLAKRIRSLWIKNGKKFLVLYLKDCVLIVQKYIAREPIYVIVDRPIGIVGGLPSIIPGPFRLAIRRGDRDSIRAVLGLLSIYRVLMIPTTLKLQTITGPFTGIEDSLPNLEISRALNELGYKPFPVGKDPIEIARLNTAGPNVNPSIFGVNFDTIAWMRSGMLLDLYRFISLIDGETSLFLELFKKQVEWIKSSPLVDWSNHSSCILGKLHIKEEPAGKARVFAAADIITQSVFKPLHTYIFSLLRTLSTDGTFNQGLPLDRLISLKKEGILDGHKFHSFDLSAATDRLPIMLQKDILGYLIGTEAAALWAKLLTERDWWFRETRFSKWQPIRYKVGQPMGALSSWAMLALTHHVVVRIAARRVGLKDFTHYAILGDDIVIANDLVAASYHSLVTESLGVEINLFKSLRSSECFEYAKRLVTVSGEVTPIGPKNILLALKSLNGIPSILLDMVNKGVHMDEAEVDKFFTSIPTVRKSALEELQWLVKGPFGFIPTESGLSSRMRLTNSLTSVSMDSLISSIDDALHELSYKTWLQNVEKAHKVIVDWDAYIIQLTQLWPEGPSPLHVHMRSLFIEDFMSLVMAMPVRRYFFGGPLIHFGFYNQGWMEGVQKYIKGKVDVGTEIVPILNPFQTEKVILPWKTNLKTLNFFKRVQEIDRAKEDTRFGWLAR